MYKTFGECRPTNSLKDFVESYWWVSSALPASHKGEPHTCIPKGTIELIIHLEGACAEILVDDEWHALPSELLVGIYSTPVVTRMIGTATRFGIKLKPEAFMMLFDTPLADLSHKYTDVAELAGSRLNWLFCMMREAPNMNARIAIAESFLQKKLLAVKEGNELITKAIRKIWTEEGNISTTSLCKSMYIGERQLQRLFKSNLGISPKLYSRIIRFRSAYEHAQSGRMDWADVAYSLGYADQAHFVKDFKNFAGVTPTALFN